MKELTDFMSRKNLDKKSPFVNPVDFVNRHFDVFTYIETNIFTSPKSNVKAIMVDGNLIIDPRSAKPNVQTQYLESMPIMYDENKGTWTKTENGYLLNCSLPAYMGIKANQVYSAFEILTVYAFKGQYESAFKYVEYNLLKKDMPYIRVGCDYYTKIEKRNVFGVKITQLKQWRKETLKDDHGAGVLAKIPKFSDFVIVPDNKEYKNIVNGMYNLYAPFPHKAHNKAVKKEDFKNIDMLLNHIFGEQVELGYKYFKILYEYPKQILPVLVLVSRDRQTGKTTFLNLLAIIFGDNHIQVTPDDLTNDFNSSYANKNVIVVDETSIEKQTAVERIKAISTQKLITVNQKHVAQYSIPFYGKIVLATNKEKEFMRIDEEEIRFWVRKINAIQKKNTNIENDMVKEVSYFLRYLEDMPDIDFTQDRMVFTADEIRTSQLQIVVEESRSWLYKDLKIKIQDIFYKLNNDGINNWEEFYATPTDIKNFCYPNQSEPKVNYIAKVLSDELKVPRFTDFDDNLSDDEKKKKTIRYTPFNFEGSSVVGKPFVFRAEDFFEQIPEVENQIYIPRPKSGSVSKQEIVQNGDLPFDL